MCILKNSFFLRENFYKCELAGKHISLFRKVRYVIVNIILNIAYENVQLNKLTI